MKVTLKDGSSKEYSQAMSMIDIAKDISEGRARVASVSYTHLDVYKRQVYHQNTVCQK